MISPSISVVSPCFNHGKYIQEMVDSVLSQSFQDIEIIIVNDGSTDDTKNILNKIDHPKIQIIHTENFGPSSARNTGISIAKGEIILNLDADDKIAPTFLEKAFKVISTDQEVGIVYCDVEFFGAMSGKFQLKEYCLTTMLQDNVICANALFRKSDWEKVGGYSKELVYGLEDYDFYLSIIEQGQKVYKIPETLCYYRQHQKKKDSRQAWRQSNTIYDYASYLTILKRHTNLYFKHKEILSSQLRYLSNLVKQEEAQSIKYPPSFSIVTPTRNRPGMLKRCINSVLSQTFTNFEHIIVDDASSAETQNMLQSLDDKRIRYIRHEKQKGSAAAYNTGMKAAKAEFICFLDDDDEYYPNFLEKTDHYFKLSGDRVGFMWCGIKRVRDTKEGEKLWYEKVWPWQFETKQDAYLAATTIGNGFGLTIRKKCLEKTGMYNENLELGTDTDFMIKLTQHFNFITIPEILVKIHHHNEHQLTNHTHDFERAKIYEDILDIHSKFLKQYQNVWDIHANKVANLYYNSNHKMRGRKVLIGKMLLTAPHKRSYWSALFNYETGSQDGFISFLKKNIKHQKQSIDKILKHSWQSWYNQRGNQSKLLLKEMGSAKPIEVTNENHIKQEKLEKKESLPPLDHVYKILKKEYEKKLQSTHPLLKTSRSGKARFLNRHEYPKWDAFVNTSPQGEVFCYSWWLETVTNGDFDIAVIEENNVIVAGFILPFFSKGAVNEPYLTRSLGILFQDMSSLRYQTKLNKIRKYQRKLLKLVPQDKVIQLVLHYTITDWLAFRFNGFGQTTKYTYIIDYSKKNIQDIWQDVSSEHKRVIQKAKENNITIEQTNDMEIIHKLNCLSYERQGKKFPYSLEALLKLDASIQKNNMRVAFKATDEQNRIHAAYYVVFNKQYAFGLLSGGDPQLRHMGGHTMIVWHIINYFSDKVRIYNFGGSYIENIELHIRKFGGYQTPYFHIFNDSRVTFSMK